MEEGKSCPKEPSGVLSVRNVRRITTTGAKMTESAWQRKEGKTTGGLNEKGRKSYEERKSWALT